MILNLCEAAVAVVLTPVSLVADICTLPATALDGRHPFGKTGTLLSAAADCVKEAVKPEDSK